MRGREKDIVLSLSMCNRGLNQDGCRLLHNVVLNGLSAIRSAQFARFQTYRFS